MQDPALHAARLGREPVSFDRLFRGLEEAGTIVPGAHVGFGTRPDRRFVAAWVSGPGHHEPHFYWVDSATGALAPERTRLADEMNRLYFLDQVPDGRELAGLASIAFLVVEEIGNEEAIELPGNGRSYFHDPDLLFLGSSETPAATRFAID